MNFGVIEITGGNLRNDHLYLGSMLDLFPPDSIGGSNEETRGTDIEVHCGIDNPIVTDIAGDKKIFRRRAWVREFFLSHNLKEGDRVVIEKTAGRRFHVYPIRVTGV